LKIPAEALTAVAEGKPLIPEVLAQMANPDWDKASARILILRLSPRKDVDISTSHLVLFDEVRSNMPDAFIDFAFLPPSRERKLLALKGYPWYFGRAEGRAPEDFDLILVSNAFALELLNLPYLYTQSGIPQRALERAHAENVPLIIIGGSNASAMGALVITDAEGGVRDALVDGIFFGEGEGAIGRLAKILTGSRAGKDGRLSSSGRAENLSSAAAVPGFWPCLSAKRAVRVTAEGRPHTLSRPLVMNGPNASTVKLSITSGCFGYCSFCLEGWDRSPFREAEHSRLLETAKTLREASGASDLELYSFNFNAYSRIFDLIFELNKIFRRVSFMSQRLDILAETGPLFTLETSAGKKSFTLGIEGVSGRMRAYYRKGLNEDHIRKALSLVVSPGIREVKLFFIIAGLETRADLDEFKRLIAFIAGIRAAHVAPARIVVSAGYLVRLPFTPLQYSAPCLDKGRLEEIAGIMEEICEDHSMEFRLASEPEECFTNQALSLFGSRLAPWLESVPQKHFVYDKTIDKGVWESLNSQLRLWEDSDFLLGEKPSSYRPPLGFIEPEGRFDTLYRHYLEASGGTDRANCLGKTCSACGVCPDIDEKKRMTSHRIEVPAGSAAVDRVASLLAAKARITPLYLAVDMPASLAHAHTAYRSSWLLREFSRIYAHAQEIILEAREALFAPSTPFENLCSEKDGRWGKTVFALFGPSPETTRKLVLRAASLREAGLDCRLLSGTPAPRSVEVSITLGDTGDESDGLSWSVLENFARSGDIAYTVRKDDSRWKMDVSPSSMKRRFLYGGEFIREGPDKAFSLSLGPRAVLSGLLDELTGPSGIRPLVRVTGWEGQDS